MLSSFPYFSDLIVFMIIIKLWDQSETGSSLILEEFLVLVISFLSVFCHLCLVSNSSFLSFFPNHPLEVKFLIVFLNFLTKAFLILCLFTLISPSNLILRGAVWFKTFISALNLPNICQWRVSSTVELRLPTNLSAQSVV